MRVRWRNPFKQMMKLSDKWAPHLRSQPETGMGYQVVLIVLRNGQRHDQVLVESGVVTRIRGLREISFKEEEIAEIVVTHDAWRFSHEP